MNKCSFCGTSYKEVMQTGFVGCEKCYQELPDLRAAVAQLYNGKKHRGKMIKRRGNGNL